MWDFKFKEYSVFAYNSKSPLGGWNDFKGTFDTVEEARSCCIDTFEKEKDFDLCHVVNGSGGFIMITYHR